MTIYLHSSIQTVISIANKVKCDIQLKCSIKTVADICCVYINLVLDCIKKVKQYFNKPVRVYRLNVFDSDNLIHAPPERFLWQ